MTLAVLPNFPMLSQLQETPADLRPPENARYDCVPTSFAAAIRYYRGGTVTGDELKDAEYGETYANAGTALWRYVDNASDLARAKYHVTAVPYSNASTVWLVGRIHTWLKQGYPVIATIPSAWSNSYDQATLAKPPFSTHVIVFYGEIDGGLEAMNPWGGWAHKGTDAYWQGGLCYGQVWAVVKEGAMATAGTTTTAPTPLEISQWHELQADRAQIATLKQQLAASRAQSAKQYAEIVSLRAQLANALKPDPVKDAALKAWQDVKSILGEL